MSVTEEIAAEEHESVDQASEVDAMQEYPLRIVQHVRSRMGEGII